MKNPMLHFTLRFLSAVAGIPLAMLLAISSAIHASPPISHEAHFHGVHDHEDMRARDSLYAATKQALNLNVGEPRTVRMIYFLPNDRPFRQEVVNSIKDAIPKVQTFYADQMEAHGYGRKTFRFETDQQGEPLVHRVDGQHPDSHYLENTQRSAVWNEIALSFDIRANVYFIVIDNSIDGLGLEGSIWAWVAGQGGRSGRIGGFVLVPGSFGRRIGGFVPGSFTYDEVTVVHEFGHAFGAGHDHRDGENIMTYLQGSRDRLSACFAKWLAVHPLFNPDIPIEDAPPPTVEHIHARGGTNFHSVQQYSKGTTSVSVQFKVSDPEGLHQVLLYGGTREPHIEGIRPEYIADGGEELIACREFSGETKAIVEFVYDGRLPADAASVNLSDFSSHGLHIVAVDRHGNRTTGRTFSLSELSPHYRATIEAHALEGHAGMKSMAFSPNGAMLATGGHSDAAGKVWDVETRKMVATLDTEHRYGARTTYISFSPDGATLAYGAWAANLWHIATQTHIATLDSFVVPLAFSHDGAMLATSSRGGWADVDLWDVETRRRVATLVATLPGHDPGVRSVAFSPDGRMLATTNGKQIKLWDLRTRQPVATLEGQEWVNTVAFSPDGTMLASAPLYTGTVDETVKVWDVKTNSAIAAFSPKGATTALAFSPDGALLASARGGSITLWDVKADQPVATFYGHVAGVSHIAFSPDGQTLASGDYAGNVELWDMSEFVTPVAIIPDVNLRAAIRDALGKSAFAPITVTDMARLTTLDASNRNIRELDGLESAPQLTDLNLEGNPLSPSAVSIRIPALQERGVAVLFDDLPVISTLTKLSGDGQKGLVRAALADPLVVSVLDQKGNGVSGVTVQFSVTSGDGILSATTVTTDTDGRAVATLTLGGEPGTNTIVATVAGLAPVTFTATGQRILLATLRGHYSEVYAVSFSPNGRTLASGGEEGTILLWDVADGSAKATLEGHTGSVFSVSFSPDGRTLASGSRDGTIRLWDVADGSAKATLAGHARRVSSVSFSPDGSTLASGGGDSTVRLWDVASGREKATLEGHTSSVSSVSFSPDGRTLASGSHDNSVRLWDMAGGREMATLAGHTNAVSSVSFAPNGRTLASGSWDNTVRLWDVASGLEKATLAGHTKWVNSVSFSPDGRTLASGSEDGTVRLWDMTRDQITATLIDHENWVYSVSFGLDGQILAGGYGGSKILLWDVAPYATPELTTPDFDGDGDVGFGDFVQFAGKFGSSQDDPDYDARFDLDGDGAIGFSDFVIFAQAFGS